MIYKRFLFSFLLLGVSMFIGAMHDCHDDQKELVSSIIGAFIIGDYDLAHASLIDLRDENINVLDHNGSTILMAAAAFADAGTIKSLLERGADSTLAQGKALVLASIRQNKEIMTLLSGHRSRAPSRRESYPTFARAAGTSNSTPVLISREQAQFFEAIKQGDVCMVRTLLDHVDLISPDSEGRSALALARVMKEKKQELGLDEHEGGGAARQEIIREIDNRRKVLYARGQQVLVTMIINALKQGAPVLIDQLSPFVGYVDTPTPRGTTLLMAAAIFCPTKTVRALLDLGASVNAENRQRHTPLAYALSENREEVVRLLLERGANPWHPSIQDDLEWYFVNKDSRGGRHMVSIVNYILGQREVGAYRKIAAEPRRPRVDPKPSLEDKQSLFRVLLNRIKHEELGAVQKLLALGVDLSLKDDEGRSALDVACAIMREMEALLLTLPKDEQQRHPCAHSTMKDIILEIAKHMPHPSDRALLAATHQKNPLSVQESSQQKRYEGGCNIRFATDNDGYEHITVSEITQLQDAVMMGHEATVKRLLQQKTIALRTPVGKQTLLEWVMAFCSEQGGDLPQSSEILGHFLLEADRQGLL